MAQITVWGDFKVNKTDNLNLSGGLQLFDGLQETPGLAE